MTIAVSIIVNADDLGMSHEVNAAIAHCFEARQVTSATILANGPAFDEAASLARSHPGVSFGVHLNVTEFAPVSRAALDPLLSAGTFVNNLRQTTLTPSLLAAIETEFDAQIARVKAAGIPVSHLDSHHHIHTVPRLLPLTLRLARKHAIPAIRQTRNIFQAGEQPSASLRLSKRLLNAALSLSGRCRTTHFGSLADVMNAATPLPAGSRIEVMVHPGGSGKFVEETAALASAWWQPLGIEPVWQSYAAQP